MKTKTLKVYHDSTKETFSDFLEKNFSSTLLAKSFVVSSKFEPDEWEFNYQGCMQNLKYKSSSHVHLRIPKSALLVSEETLFQYKNEVEKITDSVITIQKEKVPIFTKIEMSSDQYVINNILLDAITQYGKGKVLAAIREVLNTKKLYLLNVKDSSPYYNEDLYWFTGSRAPIFNVHVGQSNNNVVAASGYLLNLHKDYFRLKEHKEEYLSFLRKLFKTKNTSSKFKSSYSHRIEESAQLFVDYIKESKNSLNIGLSDYMRNFDRLRSHTSLFYYMNVFDLTYKKDNIPLIIALARLHEKPILFNKILAPYFQNWEEKKHAILNSVNLKKKSENTYLVKIKVSNIRDLLPNADIRLFAANSFIRFLYSNLFKPATVYMEKLYNSSFNQEVSKLSMLECASACNYYNACGDNKYSQFYKVNATAQTFSPFSPGALSTIDFFSKGHKIKDHINVQSLSKSTSFNVIDPTLLSSLILKVKQEDWKSLIYLINKYIV